jgi:hypothetical protein
VHHYGIIKSALIIGLTLLIIIAVDNTKCSPLLEDLKFNESRFMKTINSKVGKICGYLAGIRGIRIHKTLVRMPEGLGFDGRIILKGTGIVCGVEAWLRLRASFGSLRKR